MGFMGERLNTSLCEAFFISEFKSFGLNDFHGDVWLKVYTAPYRILLSFRERGIIRTDTHFFRMDWFAKTN
jgi:hypothetical protein